MAAAARGCNRDPEEIKLVAVSKRFPVNAILEAHKAGQVVFGENYIQEAVEKKQALGDLVDLHFIGNLQSNKAKLAAQTCAMVETVDRLKIASALQKHLDQLDREMDILVQVNVGLDSNKSGVLPGETESLLVRMQDFPRLRLRGLMTMPPFSPDPEAARPCFRALRQLSEEMRSRGLFGRDEKIALSMGMSHDYHVAIEEGATLIRIGTAIFGERPSL
jgi:pyridoxal phosphate enzyme (YggS family)